MMHSSASSAMQPSFNPVCGNNHSAQGGQLRAGVRRCPPPPPPQAARPARLLRCRAASPRHVVAFRELRGQPPPQQPPAPVPGTPTTPATPGRESPAPPFAGNGPRRDFLEARQVSLYELFDGASFQLDVPEYQRPYAWRAKQVHELLADLQAAYQSGQEHFLGAIVTTRQSAGGGPGQDLASEATAGTGRWVIDGQQRLTTLVMLLGYLRAWAAAQPGMESLAGRVEAMLRIPADPLNPGSEARWRLRLRASEQAFFEATFLRDFLPTRYHLASALDGPANAAEAYHGAGSNGGSNGASSSSSNGASSSGGSRPLANETYWRLYCAGDVLACYMADAMAGGLNLQDFAQHVLRHCVVVLMTARDESTSFKIFSTLNGRGVDLAVVDKLKPELLQRLPAAQRGAYAERWGALEAALGRPSFHALFDHVMLVERAAREAPGAGLLLLDGGAVGAGGALPAPPPPSAEASGGLVPRSSSRRGGSGGRSNGDGGSGSSIGGGGLVPRGSSLARRPGSPGPPEAPARPDVLAFFEQHADPEAALARVLEYGAALLQIRGNDWSALAAEGGSAPDIAADLEEACFFANLLPPDQASLWQPWALEFFARSADDAKRAAFLRGAERLALYCELRQDEAFCRARWLAVGAQLLREPFYSDQVLAALALTPDEVDDFVRLVDGRELAASADEGLIAHLLLRADAVNRRAVDWRRLRVEKVVPSAPPEGSQWRRQKLHLPALPPGGDGDGDAAHQGLLGGGGLVRSPRSRSSRGRTASSGGGLEPDAGGGLDDAGGTAGGTGSRSVRYWHEITRAHWHNRLGNLVLLQPPGAEAASTAHLAADLPDKLRHYAATGGDEAFPLFTGGLVAGRYTRDRFSPEECRQRHADVIARLVAVFGLDGGGGSGGDGLL